MTIEALAEKKKTALLQVFTLGTFEVWRQGSLVSAKTWGRDKTIQLFQYFLTARHRKAQHKEQIMDRLWEEDGDSGEQSCS
jgi:DNA-binding SARP family transcriptional activator